ncbi:hypothetical protein BCF55_0915 [Hydrogenivirga caldilitoris]|uniref:NifU-like protein n=1 Tax=Hydrogenivirga caldilitoris TaxID=246264 RepID=A0A497XNW1_9AQUI|nr:nicotinate phosphoribosyltransferase [Hydrogenivirga caldilitoris]RLJ70637.1 hypothetical protein BCF55_0915 [Hydrogenivirga caldilitoris]
MKVSDYIKEGLKNFVEGEAEGKQGAYSEGVHKVTVFVKFKDGKVVDCKFNSTKRCKKLLAITDYMCELLKETGNPPTVEELLSKFPEEKEKEKMENRAKIALNALKNALS